jgi:hypothetical protein
LGKARAVGDYIFLLGTTTTFAPILFLNTVYVGLSTVGAQTTIAAGSDVAVLPQATINVASTVGFPTAGTVIIVSEKGLQTVAYTGTSGGNQFTGCTGGLGAVDTGATVFLLPTAATILSNEPSSTGSYARAAVVNNPGNFSAASGSMPAAKSNAAAITFPASTAVWSSGATLLDLLFLADIATLGSGNILAYGYLTSPQAVNAAGITPSFASSAFSLTLL